jgi:hypothetical protein
MDWDKDRHGNVSMCPITGFHVAPAADIAVAVRVEYQRQSGAGEISAEAVQFVMSPDVALGLAFDLEKAANRILEMPASDTIHFPGHRGELVAWWAL